MKSEEKRRAHLQNGHCKQFNPVLHISISYFKLRMFIVFCTASALDVLIWPFQQFLTVCTIKGVSFYLYVLLNNFTEFTLVNKVFWYSVNNIYQFFRYISLNSQLIWAILNFCLKIPLLVTMYFIFLQFSLALGIYTSSHPRNKKQNGLPSLMFLLTDQYSRENPDNLSWALYQFSLVQLLSLNQQLHCFMLEQLFQVFIFKVYYAKVINF